MVTFKEFFEKITRMYCRRKKLCASKNSPGIYLRILFWFISLFTNRIVWKKRFSVKCSTTTSIISVVVLKLINCKYKNISLLTFLYSLYNWHGFTFADLSLIHNTFNLVFAYSKNSWKTEIFHEIFFFANRKRMSWNVKISSESALKIQNF